VSLLTGSLSRWFDKFIVHDGEWRMVYDFSYDGRTASRILTKSLHDFHQAGFTFLFPLATDPFTGPSVAGPMSVSRIGFLLHAFLHLFIVS
jgi:hypothetical protein